MKSGQTGSPPAASCDATYASKRDRQGVRASDREDRVCNLLAAVAVLAMITVEERSTVAALPNSRDGV